MAQFGTIITNIGLAKITNAQVTQETVGIKHMVLGDGNGAYYTLSQSQTNLRREVWRGLIADEQRDPSNSNRIVFSAYVPSTAGGFTIREVGLLDTQGNLIAVSLYPEQYKPQLAEGVSDDLLLHFVLETSNASVVTLAVDPTIIIASRKYVDDKVAGAVGNIGTDLIELQGQVTQHLDDSMSHITTEERTSWNGKYTKPVGGIPKSDLEADVMSWETIADLNIEKKVNTIDILNLAEFKIIRITIEGRAGTNAAYGLDLKFNDITAQNISTVFANSTYNTFNHSILYLYNTTLSKMLNATVTNATSTTAATTTNYNRVHDNIPGLISKISLTCAAGIEVGSKILVEGVK